MCLSSSVWETKTDQGSLISSWTTKHISYSSRDQDPGQPWSHWKWSLGSHLQGTNPAHKDYTLLTWPFPMYPHKTPDSTQEFSFNIGEVVCVCVLYFLCRVGGGGWRGTQKSSPLQWWIVVIYVFFGFFVWLVFLKKKLWVFFHTILFNIHSFLLNIKFSVAVWFGWRDGYKMCFNVLEKV